MKQIQAHCILLFIAFLTTLCGAAGMPFVNPVLPGDHPDQNIVRDGSDYYLTGSSFHMTPNLQVWHSTNLVQWERLGGAIDPNWSGQTSTSGSGAWGGFLFKRNNVWWAYTAYNYAQYFMTSSSIKGPWTTPVACKGAKGYDNSVFVDDDGKVYMVMKGGFGSQGFNGIQEIGTDGNLTGSLIDLSWINLDSASLSWSEGPTLMKRNGYYYYFTSTNTGCGGEEYAWRSRTLTGTKSAWDSLGVVLQAKGSVYGGPQHSTAPIMAPDSTWWMFYHSYECGDGWSGTGRQSILAQVTWVNDVPVVGSPVATGVGPNAPSSGIPYLSYLSDEFQAKTLGKQWQFFGKTAASLYSLTARPGYLRLLPIDSVGVVQKAAFHASANLVQVFFKPTNATQEAGIRLQNGPNNLAVKLSIASNNGEKIRLSFNGSTSETTWSGDSAWLKLVHREHRITAYASTDRTTWSKIGSDLNVSTLDDYSTNYNGWVGNFIGMYAQGASADFAHFVARDAFDTVRTEDASGMSNVQLTTATSGDPYAGNFQNGSYAVYAGIDLGEGSIAAKSIYLEAASNNSSGGTVTVREDNPTTGTVLTSCPISSTGGATTWKATQCNLNAISNGQHDLYFVVSGSSGNLLNLRAFWFSTQAMTGTTVPSSSSVQSSSSSTSTTRIIHTGTLTGAFMQVQNGAVTLRLDHAVQGTLNVLDIFGNVRATLSAGSLSAGKHILNFRSFLTNGVYIVRLSTEKGALSNKFVVVSQ